MSTLPRKSRCGFVVIKLRINGEPYLLMRRNLVWKDVNFIGGHENHRDAHSLFRAARRELLEEVPVLRSFKSIALERLTGTVRHGPIYSASARSNVEYELEFFVLKFNRDPRNIFESFGARTSNVLVRETDLLETEKVRVSALVGVLDQNLAGGIRCLPYSWQEDIGANPMLPLDQQSQRQMALD